MSKPKIIVTVINDLSYDQRMHRICSSMSHNGYDVLLVGRKLKRSLPLEKQDFRQKRLSCWFEKGKIFYLEYNIRLFLYLLFSRFDIIYSVDSDTLIPGFYTSKLKGKKQILDAHEFFSEVPEVTERPKVQNFWRSIENNYYPRIKHKITVSQSIADYFKELLDVDFEVIRNIRPLTEEIPSEKKDYIAYVGAVNQGRGLEALLPIMDQIPMELWICGDGDITDQLIEQVNDLGLEKKVIFKGFQPPDKLQEMASEAKIGYLVLEAKSKSYQFSLANKFFDYVHGLTPQVTINFPEYVSINEKSKVSLLVDGSAEQIKSALLSLIEDKELYDRLQDNCRKARLDFNWQNEEMKLLTFINSVEKS